MFSFFLFSRMQKKRSLCILILEYFLGRMSNTIS